MTDAADAVEDIQADAEAALSEGDTTAGIIEVSTLQQFVGVHTPLVSEGRIHFNDDGLRTAVVNPSNVAMHEPVTLSADAFESYESPGAATIGVSFTRLDEVLGVASASSLIQFRVDMERRMLIFEFDGVKQEIATINPDAIRKEPDTPDLDLPNMAVLTGEQLDRALTVADLNSDHIEIVGDPEAENPLSFVAEGDTDRGSVGYGPGELIGQQIQTEAKSLFSTGFWEKLTAATPADAEIELWWGSEFPARISWADCDGHLEVESMVAPRVQ